VLVQVGCHAVCVAVCRHTRCGRDTGECGVVGLGKLRRVITAGRGARATTAQQPRVVTVAGNGTNLLVIERCRVDLYVTHKAECVVVGACHHTSRIIGVVA